MPGSSVAIVGVPFSEGAAAAAGPGEIRFEPGTRLVVEEALPVSDASIDARWYRTVTSRSSAAGVTTELAELKCYIDLNGAVQSSSFAATNAVIGELAGGFVGVGTITTGVFGTILGGTMRCLEAPTVGELDINVAVDPQAYRIMGHDISAGLTLIVDSAGDWTVGAVKVIDPAGIAAGDTIYLATGGADAGAYGAGKFLLTFVCQYDVPS